MINSALVSVEIFASEEFERLMVELAPSDPNTYELIHGRILMTPPPGWPHGLYESRVVATLTNLVMARNLGLVIGSRQSFRLIEEDTVAPDVAFVPHERWAAQPASGHGQASACDSQPGGGHSHSDDDRAGSGGKQRPLCPVWGGGIWGVRSCRAEREGMGIGGRGPCGDRIGAWNRSR